MPRNRGHRAVLNSSPYKKELKSADERIKVERGRKSLPSAKVMETEYGKKKKLHSPTISWIIRRKLKKKKKKVIMVIFMMIIIIFRSSVLTLKIGIRNPPKAGLFAPSVTTAHSSQ